MERFVDLLAAPPGPHMVRQRAVLWLMNALLGWANHFPPKVHDHRRAGGGVFSGTPQAALEQPSTAGAARRAPASPPAPPHAPAPHPQATAAFAMTQCGTPYYFSPELCQNRPYNSKSDIWSLGCILYEMMALRRPFEAGNVPALVRNICRGTYAPLPPAFSAQLRGLADAMLRQDPTQRPSVNQIMRLGFVQAALPSATGPPGPSAGPAQAPPSAFRQFQPLPGPGAGRGPGQAIPPPAPTPGPKPSPAPNRPAPAKAQGLDEPPWARDNAPVPKAGRHRVFGAGAPGPAPVADAAAAAYDEVPANARLRERNQRREMRAQKPAHRPQGGFFWNPFEVLPSRRTPREAVRCRRGGGGRGCFVAAGPVGAGGGGGLCEGHSCVSGISRFRCFETSDAMARPLCGMNSCRSPADSAQPHAVSCPPGGGGVSRSPDGLFVQHEREPIRTDQP